MPLSRCFGGVGIDIESDGDVKSESDGDIDSESDDDVDSDVDDEWVSYLILLIVHVLLLSGDGILVMTVLGLLRILFFPSLDACLQRW